MAESYGGRDEPVDTLVNNLVAVNVVPVFDALRVKEMPTEGTYQARSDLPPYTILGICTSLLLQRVFLSVSSCISPLLRYSIGT